MQAGAKNKQLQLNSESAELNAKIILFKNAKTMESKLTKAQSTFKTNVSNAGAEYTTADQNDGNWWKRNMPKWLGGAGKTERGLMKDQHKLKKAAGERLEAMGVDTDNYTVKGVQKAEAKAAAVQKTNDFLNSLGQDKSKYTAYQTQITAYYMKHPDAKNDDIRKFLNIK